MCRSRRGLSNAYLLAKFRFDTAENEPCKVRRIPSPSSEVCPSRALAGGISLGINGFDGFGAELSQKYNIPVQQYDCFNTKAPAVPYGADCKFAPLCVKDKTYQNSAKFKTLSEFAAQAPEGDLFLKMDVEGAEWGALDAATPATLARFEQIALEVLFWTLRVDCNQRVVRVDSPPRSRELTD